jgi:hypothetical protein
MAATRPSPHTGKDVHDVTRKPLRLALAAGLVAGVATVATAAPANAEPAPRLPCSTGFVCINPAFGGTPINIPQGQRRPFVPQLTAWSVTNLTGLTYCFTGSPNFGLPPGGMVNSTRRISLAAPLQPGGSCFS